MSLYHPAAFGSNGDFLDVRLQSSENFVHLDARILRGRIGVGRHASADHNAGEQDATDADPCTRRRRGATGPEEIPGEANQRRYANQSSPIHVTLIKSPTLARRKA
jgi:hypothetical protein